MDPLMLLALATALAPGVVGHALPRVSRFEAGPARRATTRGAGLALCGALACTVLFALRGPVSGALLWLEVPGLGRVSLGAHVDGLTVIMLLTVTLVGAVVAHYARRYLDGDPVQVGFSRWLSYTLSAVLLLVVSSNLVMFFAGWVGTSHGLHRLLTLYPERPAALLAAHKKFVISRVGDVLLLAAFVLIYRTFDSVEFADVLPQAAAAGASGALPPLVAVLLVLGAITKSAQFPFHTWLPDTMETPTPVSALMHAGVINAGGFLIIRTSPLLVSAPGALVLLAVVGAFTALFGAIWMLTQTDVKRKYATSTVSQMGFMMLQCGLGAFPAAAMHLMGHAFYKGHAFLSASSAVDPSQPPPPREVRSAPGGRRILLALGAGAAVVAGVAFLLGVEVVGKPGFLVLSGILAIAVAQMVLMAESEAASGPRPIGLAVRDGALIAVVYFAAVGLFQRLLEGVVPAAGWQPGGWEASLALAVLPFFIATLVLQASLPGSEGGRLWRHAYVHLHNGLYLGAIQNRIVQRLWPAHAPSTGGRRS